MEGYDPYINEQIIGIDEEDTQNISMQVQDYQKQSSNDLYDENINEITAETNIADEYDKHSLIEWLPDEIIFNLFIYLDTKSMIKVAMTNKYWYELIQSKSIQYQFKNEGHRIFKESGLYSASRTYKNKFMDWRSMYMFRPRVRYDGVYISRVEYWHDGLTEFGDYNPIFKVKHYMMIRFKPDGIIMYGQNVLGPDDFIEKVQRGKIILDKGNFSIRNREIRARVQIGKSLYDYKYLLQGMMHKQTESFTLKSKAAINSETGALLPLKMSHSKAVFEFYGVKFSKKW